MRPAYIASVIACVLLLAAGFAAGCTGTTAVPAAAGPQDHPTVISTVMQPAPTQSATPVPGEGSHSGTTWHTLFVNSTANGKIITIPASERVLVRLPENPTTGFQWNATASKGLAIVSDTYTAPESPLMGAPGYHEWILAPQTVDTYTFRAVSHRPWEDSPGTDETFSLVIVATVK